MIRTVALQDARHLPVWRRPATLLFLMAAAMPIAFSTWSALLNNFVIEVANFDGSDIGWLHTVREIPGFFAIGVIAIIIFMREQVLGLVALILLGAAPCTAMVFVWSQLTRGDATYTLVQVSLNDVIMIFAFAPIVALLLGVAFGAGLLLAWPGDGPIQNSTAPAPERGIVAEAPRSAEARPVPGGERRELARRVAPLAVPAPAAAPTGA